MVLRNVPSTATFEEQRVEINELAADVDALDAAALRAESDTLQSVTDRGFTTDNPIKIENNAATAFVVEDGSSNEKFVVDSVNGKINVGSSAGGASGIYLFHNNAGATPAITLDGATGSITNKGQLVTESILSSAALNNKGSVQFGTVDAYSIGHMPLNSDLAFSQTHGGSYLFYSDASTVELEIASGGITVDGTCTVGDVVTSTIADNQFAFAIGTSAAKGGLYNHANGGYLFLRDSSSNGTLTLNGDSGSGLFTGEIKVEGSSTPTGLSSRISKYGSLLIGTSSDAVGDARCSIDSGNGNITSIGTGTFGGNTTIGAPDVTNGSTGGVQLFSSGQLRIQRDSAGTASDKRFQMYYGTTETASITAAGAAAFEQGLSVGYGTSSSSTVITRWRSDVVSANTTVASVNADGSAAFRSTITSGAADRRGQFSGTCPSTVTASSADAFVATYDSTTVLQVKYDGLASFGAASNSTGNNGVAVGGNNGSLNIYTDRYTTDCFQILNTSGSGTNIALQAFGNGKLNVAAGNLRIEDVGDGTNSVKIITDPSSGGSGSKLIFDMDNSQEAVTIYNAGLKVGSGGSDKINLNGSDGSITADGTISDNLSVDVRRVKINNVTSAQTVNTSNYSSGEAIVTVGGGSVTFEGGASGLTAGSMITVVNNHSSSCTLTEGSGMTLRFTDGTTGNKTLAGYGVATILYITNSAAVISGSGVS